MTGVVFLSHLLYLEISNSGLRKKIASEYRDQAKVYDPNVKLPKGIDKKVEEIDED